MREMKTRSRHWKLQRLEDNRISPATLRSWKVSECVSELVYSFSLGREIPSRERLDLSRHTNRDSRKDPSRTDAKFRFQRTAASSSRDSLTGDANQRRFVENYECSSFPHDIRVAKHI